MTPTLRKWDFKREDPWRHMAGLPLQHPDTMRRVMVLIYHKLNPSKRLNLPESYNWMYLTRNERQRVKEMLKESNNNDLLVEMLLWFSAQHRAKDEEVINASQTLRKFVVNAVRQPRMYQVEYLEAREEWNEFLGKDDIEMGGVDILSTTPCRPCKFITSVGQAKVDTLVDQGNTRSTTVITASQIPTVTSLLESTSISPKEQREGPLFGPKRRRGSAAIPVIDGPFSPSKRQRKEDVVPTLEAQSFTYSGAKPFSALTQPQRHTIITANSYDLTDEDASTLSEDSSDDDEPFNIFTQTTLPGSPKKTRAGRSFATLAAFQRSPKKISRGGKGKDTLSRVRARKVMEEDDD